MGEVFPNIIKAGFGLCELCGKEAELRPYGPGGKFICFACGMADRAGTERRFGALLQGGLVVDATDQDGDPSATLKIEENE
jgi:hypothetical protein